MSLQVSPQSDLDLWLGVHLEETDSDSSEGGAAAEMHACSVRVDAVVSSRLQVIPVARRDCLKRVRKIADGWSVIALQEGRITQNEREKEALLGSHEVNAGIAFALRQMLKLTRSGERDGKYDVYACVEESESGDQKKRVQGVMLIEKNFPYVFIAHLAANPYNLCANSMGVPRVRGAGTSLIEHAKDLARVREEGHRFVQLEVVTKGAKGFYDRCGFTFQGGTAMLAV